jgi:hypothetical protein
MQGITLKNLDLIKRCRSIRLYHLYVIPAFAGMTSYFYFRTESIMPADTSTTPGATNLNGTNLNGKCLCQKVGFTVSEVKPHVDACHCSTCRKWSGGPLLAVESDSEVAFTGEAHITVFDSSEWAERGFCSNCGTHLFYRLKNTTHYAMPVGLFEGAENFTFTTQIFTEEKPSYYDFANKTKMMTGEEVFAAFAGD